MIRAIGLLSFGCHPGCDGVACRAAALERAGYFRVLYSGMLPVIVGKN